MNVRTITCSSGRSCTARTRPNRPYCFAHDPDPRLRRAGYSDTPKLEAFSYQTRPVQEHRQPHPSIPPLCDGTR